MPGFIKVPGLQDKIHCCVFVLDANSILALSDALLSKLSDMRAKITARGLSQPCNIFISMGPYFLINQHHSCWTVAVCDEILDQSLHLYKNVLCMFPAKQHRDCIKFILQNDALKITFTAGFIFSCVQQSTFTRNV